MTLTKTPICNFGEKAKNFNLLSTENKKVSLDQIKGENGTLIMFICNHCPYVKAVIKDIFLFSVDGRIKFLAFSPKLQIGVSVSDIYTLLIN